MRNFLSFHGFEPSFVDQTSVMHTRGAACGATRRGAALLENFGVKSRLHTSFSQSKQHGEYAYHVQIKHTRRDLSIATSR